MGTASRKYGRADVSRVFEAEHDRGLPGYVCPCVFEKLRLKVIGGQNASPNVEYEAHYYIWLFGFVFKTPYVRSQRDTLNRTRGWRESFDDVSWASYDYRH
ncbi:hypothetical protein CGZ80_21215 [Rhodopirellula sp. MGV]|nr:hypothetical protein CGZ80_21215 [Rhodopirellula sp. MGV]PNY35999.1 hypothetical protein C2E31_15255 [Rhodopirellula baltica]